MSEARKDLLGALEARFIPVLLAKGFKQFPLEGEENKSPEMKTAFPFGYMKRQKGGDLHLLEIQFDKHGAAKFVLNFGVVPRGGISLPWIHLEQDKASVSALPDAYRLYQKRSRMKWFSASFFASLFNRESRIGKVVDDVIALYPEIETWFASGSVGLHMRKFGYPSKT